MDAAGNLYVGNYNSNSIAVFAPGSSITSIAPKSGPTAGATPITITGTGFSTGATVTIGGKSATNVQVVSGTKITAVTPAHAAGSVDVRVTSGGSTAVDPGGFTFVNELATTGIDASPSVGLGLGLLAAGGILLLLGAAASRRRHIAH
jgi:hypothetical protein